MTRIDNKFAELRSAGKKGFVAYITAGDPSLKETAAIVLELEKVGVDVVELGIPFSDPLADGRVNQESATRALEAGATLNGVLDMVTEIRKESQIPIMCYSYMNPVHAHGFEKIMKKAKKAGVDGFLLLDLPVEEAGPYHEILEAKDLNHIYLVTPTSPAERVKRIVKQSTGFVYAVSRTGVTGMQSKLDDAAGRLLKLTKKHTKSPVALGFGISTPAQAAAAGKHADAIVVGSAIVDRFHKAPRTAKGRASAARWVGTLVKAVKEL